MTAASSASASSQQQGKKRKLQQGLLFANHLPLQKDDRNVVGEKSVIEIDASDDEEKEMGSMQQNPRKKKMRKEPSSPKAVHPFFQKSFHDKKKKKKKEDHDKAEEEEEEEESKSAKSIGSSKDPFLINIEGKDDEEIIHKVHEFFITAEQRKRKRELITLSEFRKEMQRSKKLANELNRERIFNGKTNYINPLELLSSAKAKKSGSDGIDNTSFSKNADSVDEDLLLGEHNWQNDMEFPSAGNYISRKKKWSLGTGTHIGCDSGASATSLQYPVGDSVIIFVSESTISDEQFGLTSIHKANGRDAHATEWIVSRERKPSETLQPSAPRTQSTTSSFFQFQRKGELHCKSLIDRYMQSNIIRKDLSSTFDTLSCGFAKEISLHPRWQLQNYRDLLGFCLMKRFNTDSMPLAISSSSTTTTTTTTFRQSDECHNEDSPQKDTCQLHMEESEGRLWTEKYHPICHNDISGNTQSVGKLMEWLKHWKHKTCEYSNGQGDDNDGSDRNNKKKRKTRSNGANRSDIVKRSKRPSRLSVRSNLDTKMSTKGISFFFQGMKDHEDKSASPGFSETETEDGRDSLSESDSDAEMDAILPPSVKKDDEINLDQSEFLSKSNLIVLRGTGGSGKTSTVYAVARELGFKVFEINPSLDRTKDVIMKAYGESSQSYNLGKYQGESDSLLRLGNAHMNTKTNGENNLILLDEIDIDFGDEIDKGFASAVRRLIATSKCPIVMTCKDLPTSESENPYGLESRHFLDFANIEELDNVRQVKQQMKHKKRCLIPGHSIGSLDLVAEKVMHMKCILRTEGLSLDLMKELTSLAAMNLGDLRRMLFDCQFWLQKKDRLPLYMKACQPEDKTKGGDEDGISICEQQDDVNNDKRYPWIVEKSMGIRQLCADLTSITRDNDRWPRKTTALCSDYSIPIYDELILSRQCAPVGMDLIFHNYMDMLGCDNLDETSHDTERQRDVLLQIASFMETQSQNDMHWDTFHRSAANQEPADDRTEQLLAMEQLMHFYHLRDHASTLPAARHDLEPRSETSDNSSVRMLSCGLRTNDRLLHAHTAMKQRVACGLARKSRLDVFSQSHTDHNLILTLSEICHAEDQRRTQSKRRRFFHQLHHIYDDTELQALMNFARPLRQQLGP